MNLEEAFRPENQSHIQEQNEQKKFLENMLQVGWFQHRASMLGETGMHDRIEKIRQASPEQTERIDKASPEELQEIVMEDMINDTEGGSVESVWFRQSFLPSSQAKELLDQLEKNPDQPERVFGELDRLFAASHH